MSRFGSPERDVLLREGEALETAINTVIAAITSQPVNRSTSQTGYPMIETLEQMRARLDQYGASRDDADFIVDLVTQLEEKTWLIPLTLMAIAETANRIGAKTAARLILTTCTVFLDEMERSTE